MTESIPKAWFRRVWNEGEVAAIDELFAKGGKAYGIQGSVIRGPEEFRQFHAAFCAQFSDIHIEVMEEICDQAKVAVQCNAKMSFRATGRNVEFMGASFLRLHDGQIIEAWNIWDFLGCLESMQLMPGNAFGLALGGQLGAHPQVGGGVGG